jgi:hypothetical protein
MLVVLTDDFVCKLNAGSAKDVSVIVATNHDLLASPDFEI